MARSSGGLLQTSFVIHAVVFGMVVGGLIAMNHQLGGKADWSLIVAWGWGIGLAAHGTVWLLWGRKPQRK
ncbi:MAG TPA: 2TM domain-containing protein [Aquabacterium sp.]|uniref:2TM domain-containing protein n=1 Tax=Aquabacterium sp. TaxID=1872578 RepID=UPI002E362E6E|nr:2TM domain-containing protein [Aquabacterium sp.]HEX5371577.1 2TM domain-containing protein [Aquabacterium sp.]